MRKGLILIWALGALGLLDAQQSDPLKIGEIDIKQSVLTDVPLVESPQPAVTEKFLRVFILPPENPAGDFKIRFEKPLDTIKALKVFSTKGVQFTLEPGLKGKYSWKNPSELVFTPDPGQLSVGQYIYLTLDGRVPVLGEGDQRVSFRLNHYIADFSMGTKVSPYPVMAGKPRFVSSLDSHTYEIGRGPLMLLYDQKVDAKELARNVTIYNEEGEVPFLVKKMSPLDIDSEGLYEPDHVLALELDPLPPDGSELTVECPTIDSDGRSSIEILNFRINTDFHWESDDLWALRDGAAAPLESFWTLRLSNRFDFQRFLDDLSITPAPLRLQTSYWPYDRTVQLQLTFETGKRYRIKVSDRFKDLIGNSFADSLDFEFKSQDLPPVLQLPERSLTLEMGANRLPVNLRNVADLEVTTWLFPSPQDFARAWNTSGPLDPAAWNLTKGKTFKPATARLTENLFHTTELGVGTETGLKLIQVTAQGTGSQSEGTLSRTILVESTNLGISAKVSRDQAFVWVTQISNTVPLNGVDLSVMDSDGRILAKGRSNKDGWAALDLEPEQGIVDQERALTVLARTATDASICNLRDDELSNAWQFNLPASIPGQEILHAALFTDRGAYRPGETVHFKAFIRPLPEYGSGPMDYSVSDPRGQKVFAGRLEPDGYKGVAEDWLLGDAAAVGEYQISLSQNGRSARAGFRVEEYRVPTFQVLVTSPDPEWRMGESVRLAAKGAYLQGGKLDGRAVAWRVYRQPEPFLLPQFPGYVFTLDRDPSATGNAGEAQGVLNADSESSFRFTPDHPEADGPVRYIAQAAVTDVDRQTYAGQLSKVVHSAAFYPGIRPPPRAILRQGERLTLPALVVSPDGKPQAGIRFELWLDRLSYHTSTMLNDQGRALTYNRQVIDSVKLMDGMSESGPTEVKLALDSAGSFIVRLSVTDPQGRLAQSGFVITVSGDEKTAWPRFDKERIDLVLDKKTYKAGETAQVVVQSPFAQARGLLTLEAGGVIQAIPFQINNDTPSIKVPLKAEYAPNVYASVLLIRGRSHFLKDATGFETGAPAYKIGYASIAIDPADQRLAVSVSSSSARARPGEELTLSVAVKTSAGKPSEASCALMVVDEAVLGLTAFRTPDPILLAYGARTLGVRNASNLLDLPYSLRERFEALFPGGDSDEAFPLPDQGELLRKLFKSTAYWNPSVPVAADGTARVSFRLPDNLTTYRVMAVAVNRAGQMGSGDSAIQARLPLMVQPVLPRFVYPGDELTIQARILNGTENDGQAQITAAFSGVQVLQAPSKNLVSVKKGGTATAEWRVKVLGGREIGVQYQTSMAGEKDAVDVKIPIRAVGNKVSVSSSGRSGAGQSVSLAVPAFLPKTLALKAVISYSPLSSLKTAVDSLMGYPNGCIEQTTSTAYPLIVLKDLLPQIGVEVSAEDLKNFSEAGVKRLLSFQTTAGGLAYWPGSDSPHAFGTAFGLTALIEAKKRGYEVPDKALKGMGDYLEASLRQGTISGEMPHGGMADADTRALFVMTLGRLGRPQPAYISTLWQKKDALSAFGLSFLAIAVKEAGGDQSLLAPLLAQIKKAAEETAGEAYFDGKPKGGWSLDSPLRTHAGALMAYALVGAAFPGEDLSQKLLTGLLNRQRYGLWGNTQENVFGIMGIHQLVARSGAASAGPVSLIVNGKVYDAAALKAEGANLVLELKESDLNLKNGVLEAMLNDPSGRTAFLTLRATYETPLDTPYRKAKSQGIEYSRRYESLDGRELAPDQLPLGEVLRVRLKVRSGEAQHYTAFDDLLPAGLEPMNEALATTERVERGPLSAAEARTLALISYKEIRDHRVAFYADELPAGDYEFTYLAKAATPGVFLAPAGRAEAMYLPDYHGTTAVETVTVK